MSNRGSRSAQRPAISSISNSESAVVSLVTTCIAIHLFYGSRGVPKKRGLSQGLGSQNGVCAEESADFSNHVVGVHIELGRQAQNLLAHMDEDRRFTWMLLQNPL